MINIKSKMMNEKVEYTIPFYILHSIFCILHFYYLSISGITKSSVPIAAIKSPIFPPRII